MSASSKEEEVGKSELGPRDRRRAEPEACRGHRRHADSLDTTSRRGERVRRASALVGATLVDGLEHCERAGLALILAASMSAAELHREHGGRHIHPETSDVVLVVPPNSPVVPGAGLH